MSNTPKIHEYPRPMVTTGRNYPVPYRLKYLKITTKSSSKYRQHVILLPSKSNSSNPQLSNIER